MRGTRNDFDDDDDVNDENDALFFTDGEASRWWWKVVFFDVDDASANVLERRWFQKNSLTRAREIEEKEDDAIARGEKRRAKCARGETTDAGESRVAFFLADVSAARSGGARWRDSRF